MNKHNINLTEVTPDIAQAWVKNAVYENQRNLTKDVVTRYALLMGKGEWGLSESNIILGVVNGSEHLMNGRHRINAVIESDTTQKFNVEYRHYDNHGQMDAAYALMDQHSRRTALNAYTALGTASMLGVETRLMRSLDGAMSLIAQDFMPHSGGHMRNGELASHIVRHEAMLRLKAPIYAAGRSFDGATAATYRWYMRAPILAVAVVTFAFAPEKAVVFWKDVCENDGLMRGTGQHALHEYLSTHKMSALEDRVGHAKAAQVCWNAFCEDRILRVIRFEYDAPFTIKGTPWNGTDKKFGLGWLLGKG